MGLSVATFNVENLLDAPGARSAPLLARKLEALAAKVVACDADVVGLQEIGSSALLARLVARVGGGYGAPVEGTRDARGIGCALLSRVPVREARVHTTGALSFPVFRAGDPPPFGARIPLRRGIVHARVEAPGLGDVDVLVAHFKSARPVLLEDASGGTVPARSARARAEGALRSLVWRTAEALFVRGLVDGVLAARPGALAAVVGDLNDTPDSRVVRTLLGEGDAALRDCTAGVDAAARYSTLHEGRGVQIDHVLATPGLHARLVSARFLNEDLRDHGQLPETGDEALTADSDHAPLVVRFA